MHHDSLTNEKLSGKFDSQFELVNYLIKLAENMIKSGREARVHIDTNNRAMQLIAEVEAGKDKFDEIIEFEPEEQEELPQHERVEGYFHKFKEQALFSNPKEKLSKALSRGDG